MENIVPPGGKHIILDMYNIHPVLLSDTKNITKILEDSAKQAGASVLNSTFHHFGEGCGVTGVVVLAESHISIHTWKQEGYAAIDIFMCGDSDPQVAASIILEYFKPLDYNSKTLIRG